MLVQLTEINITQTERISPRDSIKHDYKDPYIATQLQSVYGLWVVTPSSRSGSSPP